MDNENWLKYGAIALGVVGFLVIVGIALSGDGGEIEGRSWVVQEMTIDGASVSPIELATPVANFVDGTISGIAGCNNYSGPYTIDGGSITIGPLASTLKFCGETDGVMDQEVTYLTLLQSAESFSVSGDTLTLLEGDVVVIEFVVLEAQQLDG